MTQHRSSTWEMIRRHCLHTLRLYELGAEPVMPPAVHVGSAAHALLQAVGEETEKLGRAMEPEEIEALSDEVAARLTAQGRTFEGEPEDPLPPLSVADGLELAESWLTDHPIYPGGQYEVGLAVDRDWKPTEYGPAAWYRAILDVHRVTDVDLVPARLIRDYKSYWRAGARELRGVQMRGQAVLAHIHGLTEGMDMLRVEIANLRTHGFDHVDLDLHSGSGQETLRRWRRQIERRAVAIEQARDEGGGLPASPGPGCMGCPYLGVCQHARVYLEATDIPEDPGERARLWSVLAAKLDQVRELLELDADGGRVKISGTDQLVGWHARESWEPSPTMHHELAEIWTSHSSGDPNLAGLLLAARLGKGNLEAIGRQLAPGDREKQWAAIEPLTQKIITRRWGVSERGPE